MGWYRNHAIIVTGSKGYSEIQQARKKAEELFPGLVTNLVEGWVNGFETFVIVPDGSKEGWPESDQGDCAREAMKEWLHAQAFKDGSSPLDWVEVRYGGDDYNAAVIAHADERLKY